MSQRIFGFGLGFLAATLSACSPGMFFGDGKDQKIIDQQSYGKINTACAGMDLSTSVLSVTQFRQIVTCFNSNNGLGPIARLVDRLQNDELSPIVDLVNRHVLNNKTRMYELDVSHNQLKSQGILEATLRQVGRLLENGEMISAGVGLMKEGYCRNGNSFSRYFVGCDVDHELLDVMARFSSKVNSEAVSDALTVGLVAATSPSFLATQKRFRGDSLSGRELLPMAQAVADFLKDPAPQSDLAKDLLQAVVDGRLFSTFDDLTGYRSGMSAEQDRELLRQKLPEIALGLKVLGLSKSVNNSEAPVRDARLMDDISSLFNALIQPMSCMRSSQSVQDPTLFIIHELSLRETPARAASYLKRDIPLRMVAMNPFCNYPQELTSYYGAMVELTDTNAIESTMALMQALDRNALAPLLTQLLADTGADNASRLKRLLPIVAELTDRNIWDDALFLTSVLNHDNRADVQDAVKFVLESSPQLGGKSIYDVVSGVVGRASALNLYRFAKSLKVFVDSEEPLLVPSLSQIRQAYFINEAHPAVELMRDVLAEAPRNAELFKTLFNVSDFPEFAASVEHLSTMAKNGELQALLDTTFALFHKFAMEGKDRELPLTTAPALNLQEYRRHDWSTASSEVLALTPALREGVDLEEPCRKLKFDIAMDVPGSQAYDSQIGYYLSCVAYGSQSTAERDVLDFVSCKQSSKYGLGCADIPGVGSLLDAQIQMSHDLRDRLSDAQVLDLTSRLVAQTAQPSGHVVRTLRSLPYLALTDLGGGQLITPALQMFKAAMTGASLQVRRLMDYGAQVLTYDNASIQITRALGYAECLLDYRGESENCDIQKEYQADDREVAVPTPAASMVPSLTEAEQQVRRQKLLTLVRDVECLSGSEAELRVTQIIEDFEKAANVNDYNRARPNGTYEQRRTWAFNEVKSSGDWVVRRLVDSHHAAESSVYPSGVKDALKGMLRFTGYFSLDPIEGQVSSPYRRVQDGKTKDKHYAWDYLPEYVRERAIGEKAIVYFPRIGIDPRSGDPIYAQKPIVKLVTPLDRLELVVLNADFSFLLPENFGLKFLALIGEAWGDEECSVWPDEIKRKHKYSLDCVAQRGATQPKRIKTAYQEILDTQNQFKRIVGFPQISGCIKRTSSEPEGSPYRHSFPDPYFHGLGAVPDWVKASLFNLGQVIDAVAEDLPESGIPGRSGGMRVLRDLFWELDSSTHANYRNAKSGRHHNLKVLIQLVDMGLLRQIAKIVREMPRFNVDPNSLEATYEVKKRQIAAREFFRAITEAIVHPKTEAIARVLFKQDQNAELFWKVWQTTFDVIENGTARDIDNMKYFALYTIGLASKGRLGNLDSLLNVAESVINGDFGGEKGYQYLARQSEHLKSLMTWDWSTHFVWAMSDLEQPDGLPANARESMVNLFNDALADPSRAMDLVSVAKAVDDRVPGLSAQVSSRVDALQSLPEFKALKLSEVARSLLDYFQDERSDAAGKTLREFAAGNTDLFYRILQSSSQRTDAYEELFRVTASNASTGQTLDDFVRMANDALTQPIDSRAAQSRQ